VLLCKSHKYYLLSVCVLALSIRHAKHIFSRVIVLSSAAYLAVPNFFTLSKKRQNFRKKVIEYNICVLVFPTTFVSNIFHSKNWARYFHKCQQVLM
jgi:hypothetical protein